MPKYKDWLEDEKLTLIEGWARDGLTDEQIAHNMGIAYSTFYEWKKKYSEFSNVLKKGKEVVDFEVENALLKKALGYEYEELVIDVVTDENGKEHKHKKVIKKKALPDVTAQIFWLKNRRPDKWRDKVDRNITADIEDLQPLSEMINFEDTDD